MISIAIKPIILNVVVLNVVAPTSLPLNVFQGPIQWVFIPKSVKVVTTRPQFIKYYFYIFAFD
jgi:hypothetical protein